MSEKNTGGPAFPESCNGFIIPGMTLRDYFAGQALAGLMTSYATASGDAEQCIKAASALSYAVADYMLKERDK
jgi:hypothetical protein